MKFLKPKFWDYSKPNLLSYFMQIFTIPVRVNNYFLKFKKINKINKTKTICVGNIYVGGTGKTPSTIRLYELLKKNKYKVIIGRKYYSSQIDEQILLKNKSEVVLENKRIEILEKLQNKRKQIIIFDDGLQDRSINYDLTFVCFDKKLWIGNNKLIPSGPLREKLDSLKKYDAVLIKGKTKKTRMYVNQIKKYNKDIEVFFSEIIPTNIHKFSPKNSYLIFSGVGNPRGFKEILIKNKINIKKQIIYPDHYQYSAKDIEYIKSQASELNLKIITTEKDYVKLSKSEKKNIEFLDVRLKFLNEKKLINFIKLKFND